MRRLLVAAIVAMVPGMALARQGNGHTCFSPPFADDSTPIQLTDEQSAFLKGLWSGNPETPPSLPYGAGAAWVIAPDGGAVSFFIDGPMRCDVMILEKRIVGMTMDIGRGVAPHGESN